MSEMDRQKDVREPERFQSGKALAEFLKESFPITEREGDMLVFYMEEQKQLLGQRDGALFRGQRQGEEDAVSWESCTIDDVISDVCDYNYDKILQVTQEFMDTGTVKECVEVNARLNKLCDDEKLLDTMFDRTKHGKEIEVLAQVLAEELIKNAESKEGLDQTIQKLTGVIGKGKETSLQPPPEEKKHVGRSR